MRLELLAHLLLQGDARVEHHPQHADDLQVGVEVGVHLLDCVDQIGQPLQREVLALHRHDHAVCAAQAIEREQAKLGGQSMSDQVVLACHCVERRMQALVAPLKANQLDFCACELPVSAQNVVATHFGTLPRL